MVRLARARGGAGAGPRVTRTLALEELLGRRTAVNLRFFEAEADRIARLCGLMAERFAAGGRLLALGSSPQDRSDQHHVAVEFVHPVIVGKRALPALAVADEALDLLAAPEDMAIVFGRGRDAVAQARALGCVTIGFGGTGAEWELEPPTGDPFVRQEVVETLYHVLWELVHVFFEHGATSSAGAGASSFLYPFLEPRAAGLEALVHDVARSVVLKATEVTALRVRTFEEGGAAIAAAAAALAEALDGGGKLLAFGNGGSATDAMDVVADFRAAPQGLRRLPALDLTEDAAILTALANDIGPEVLFSRQLIAYGREGDVALALSTSGGSANIVEALAEARRRGLVTVALLGYDGGRIAAEGLADHVIVAPSEHVPRIQEAHATVYHALRELVDPLPPPIETTPGTRSR
jgi:D-sedoheptulose 7-phosphate isomerase